MSVLLTADVMQMLCVTTQRAAIPASVERGTLVMAATVKVYNYNYSPCPQVKTKEVTVNFTIKISLFGRMVQPLKVHNCIQCTTRTFLL